MAKHEPEHTETEGLTTTTDLVGVGVSGFWLVVVFIPIQQ